MENLNLQRAKSLLNRNYSVKGKVTLAKQSFSKYQPILGEHLARLNLRELSPRLAWFPFECFHDIQQVGRGGFATVYSATVCADKPGAFLDRSRVALKTLDEQHLQERPFVQLRIGVRTPRRVRPSGQEIVQLLSNMLPNGIEPTAQPVPFSPMTLEFIAERHAMHRQELSDPDSFAFFTDRNSSRFMTPEELSRCGPRRLH
ncbi:hypothetical protein BC938DRAFT_478287 [Jimgerdemannia flammicorona]|uniref:Protein kinase domain-containing protein n=1 Tax=Jimgerdemannia flammicorona TaxID=994334 RepID=A0A433QYH5_9FUNG|nr:hypothetical protein BC938DRAFT_478287 [Jimgerdemannia flammicorona]